MGMIGKVTLKTVTQESVYLQSFRMLYADLEETFRYVQPAKDHFDVYSFRYYELLLRASTEFESLCKEQLVERKLLKKDLSRSSVKDYVLLNQYGKDRLLSKFQVIFKFDQTLIRTPLSDWNSGYSLSWYQDYNKVKHHRQSEFQRAKLSNVLDAVAGIFLIIYACSLCSKSQFTYSAVYGKVKNNDDWPLMLKDTNG